MIALALVAAAAAAPVQWRESICECSAVLPPTPGVSPDVLVGAIDFTFMREPPPADDAAMEAYIKELRAVRLPPGKVWDELRAIRLADARFRRATEHAVATGALAADLDGHVQPGRCLSLAKKRAVADWRRCVVDAIGEKLYPERPAKKAYDDAMGLMTGKTCSCDKP